MLHETDSKKQMSPVRIVEILCYQGRISQKLYWIYRAHSGWFFLKQDFDEGTPLRTFAGLGELESLFGEPLRITRRYQVLRDHPDSKPAALKLLYRREQ